METTTADSNTRPHFDRELVSIAEYVTHFSIESREAFSAARYCLMDALGCAMLALQHPACKKLLGPIVEGTQVPDGARVPGTEFILDPILAAFNIGTMVRWLDFNDTWLAAEWGHPSDNLGAILAVADFVSRTRIKKNLQPLIMRDVLTAMIKAYEIQGLLALENSFNRLGIDHVVLVKIASSAVATQLLGGDINAVMTVLSHAFVDGQSLRTYRHAPNTGSRKSWAAGDATSRAVRLSWLVLRGESGLPSALTAKNWGFYASTLHGETLKLLREWGSYVIENILFKISFPAEFHAQTAVECALALHPEIKNKLDDIDKIILTTQESALRIISKQGPLYNPADRDHCLQYMVAVALIHGELNAESYSDHFAQDPRIDALRDKMQTQEDKKFSADYLNPDKRAIANSIQIYFTDGTHTDNITVKYPLGHPRRRDEGIPLLIEKFVNNLEATFTPAEIDARTALFLDQEKLEKMPVNEFMEYFISRPHSA
jgi:2-methylcitrate dehydratase